MKTKTTIESKVREIKRATKRKFSAEEKIRIVLEVFRADDSLAAICRREGIHPNLYYTIIFVLINLDIYLVICLFVHIATNRRTFQLIAV